MKNKNEKSVRRLQRLSWLHSSTLFQRLLIRIGKQFTKWGMSFIGRAGEKHLDQQIAALTEISHRAAMKTKGLLSEILINDHQQDTQETVNLLEAQITICNFTCHVISELDKRIDDGRPEKELNRELLFHIEESIMYLSDLFNFEKTVIVGRQMLNSVIESSDIILIPDFRPRDTPVTNTWTYQNDILEWDIEPNELVLDIGSGGYPFGRATHLGDMYLGQTSHRSLPLLQDGRPVICFDIQNTPFADRTWDFVFCSHVLEHLDRPGDALRELMRIGSRGYIEVPTRLSDVMLNFNKIENHHRWHGLVLEDTLVLIEWPDKELRDLGSDYFYCALQSKYFNQFQEYFENNWDIFYAMLRWRDKIKFLIIDKHGQITDRS